MLEVAKAALQKAGFTIENLNNCIKELEAENAKLKEPKTCETCKHRNECEINESSVHYLSWRFNRQCEDSEFGCFYHEPKVP